MRVCLLSTKQVQDYREGIRSPHNEHFHLGRGTVRQAVAADKLRWIGDSEKVVEVTEQWRNQCDVAIYRYRKSDVYEALQLIRA